MKEDFHASPFTAVSWKATDQDRQVPHSQCGDHSKIQKLTNTFSTGDPHSAICGMESVISHVFLGQGPLETITLTAPHA